MTEEKIARINALAKKQRSEGLSDEEKKEQAELRAEFIRDFRANLRGQLERIDIVEKDGSITSVKERHDKKYGSSEFEK